MPGSLLSEQLADLDTFAQKELDQAQRDMDELRVLMKQTSGEVERLTQRASQPIARQRETEVNLENFSRQELRQVFAAASEAQLRLFMMQSQMEQLQSRQRSLEKYIETLQRVTGFTASASSCVDESDLAMSTQPSPSYTSPAAATVSRPAAGQQTIAMIIQAQEDERNRVARQIHDGPAQALTNVVLRAEICERLMGVDPFRARAELSQLKDLVTSTLRDTRRFIFDVRPMILDDLGLFPTLKKYIETFGEKSKFVVDLTIMGQERRLPPHIEVAAFRIVQEALQNVAQHANAGKARVTLDTEGDRVGVVVEDDGVGFNVDDVLDNVRQHGSTSLGIASMVERIEMCGGHLDFESTPGHGTRLVASIPIGN